MPIKFGPSGNPDRFYEEGHKSSLDMPAWVNANGLDAYEYNCTKGVKIKEETARKLGENARDNGISLSLHAQYYISLSSPKEDIRANSVRYILESLKCADWIGATRIVVHSGGVGKLSREQAMELAKDTLQKAVDAARAEGLAGISICPETMGKINQLGDAYEVAQLCKVDETFLPTIDFGHLNARTHGGLKTEADFGEILDLFLYELGFDRMKHFHCHFSKIEYTQGGEKMHLTFAQDDVFGPNYEPFLDAVCKRNLEPMVICESAGTQADDALAMKQYDQTLKGADIK